jgi:hypothetical protein
METTGAVVALVLNNCAELWTEAGKIARECRKIGTQCLN